jgi:hypothetical protein
MLVSRATVTSSQVRLSLLPRSFPVDPDKRFVLMASPLARVCRLVSSAETIQPTSTLQTLAPLPPLSLSRSVRFSPSFPSFPFFLDPAHHALHHPALPHHRLYPSALHPSRQAPPAESHRRSSRRHHPRSHRIRSYPRLQQGHIPKGESELPQLGVHDWSRPVLVLSRVGGACFHPFA